MKLVHPDDRLAFSEVSGNYSTGTSEGRKLSATGLSQRV